MKLNEEEKKSLEFVKELMKHPVPLHNTDFRAGNMILFAYRPKDVRQPYDANPLILVAHSTSKHILGINLHWAPPTLKSLILKNFIKSNAINLKLNRHLEFRRSMKTLWDLSYPIWRKYIVKNISRKGAIIPPDLMGYTLNLRSEHFIGISAERAYQLTLEKLRNRR